MCYAYTTQICGSIPLYCATKSGDHWYNTRKVEHDDLVNSSGWSDCGIAAYVLPIDSKFVLKVRFYLHLSLFPMNRYFSDSCLDSRPTELEHSSTSVQIPPPIQPPNLAALKDDNSGRVTSPFAK